MSSAGGHPSRQKMVSVGTSIVPPGPCPPPADTPGASSAITTPQATASLHDFAGSLKKREPHHEEDHYRTGLSADYARARAHLRHPGAGTSVLTISGSQLRRQWLVPLA